MFCCWEKSYSEVTIWPESLVGGEGEKVNFMGKVGILQHVKPGTLMYSNRDSQCIDVICIRGQSSTRHKPRGPQAPSVWATSVYGTYRISLRQAHPISNSEIAPLTVGEGASQTHEPRGRGRSFGPDLLPCSSEKKEKPPQSSLEAIPVLQQLLYLSCNY